MSEITDVRPSPIAGRWYSADPHQLAAEVDGYLAAARLPDTGVEGEPLALIAPHAGLRYSGPVAGHAFRTVQDRSYDLVVIVSPMHQPHPGHFLTTSHQAYRTPLGDVPVDREALKLLESELTLRGAPGLTQVTRDTEHSLEIELPFLQRALAEPFRLLPLMSRADSLPAARQLGQALAASLAGRPVLLVASTDLSHFFPQPVAETLDARALEQIEAFSPEGLYRAAELGETYACGLNGVAAVLVAAQQMGGRRVQLLRYATSAAETGDETSVVGYAAAVILR